MATKLKATGWGPWSQPAWFSSLQAGWLAGLLCWVVSRNGAVLGHARGAAWVVSDTDNRQGWRRPGGGGCMPLGCEAASKQRQRARCWGLIGRRRSPRRGAFGAAPVGFENAACEGEGESKAGSRAETAQREGRRLAPPPPAAELTPSAWGAVVSAPLRGRQAGQQRRAGRCRSTPRGWRSAATPAGRCCRRPAAPRRRRP